MTAITVENREWDILNALRSALLSATGGESPIFSGVHVLAGSVAGLQTMLRGSGPVAMLTVRGVREYCLPEDERGCVLDVDIVLGARVAAESSGVQETMRCMNAAKNAIEAEPPPGSRAFGAAKIYLPRVAWGIPTTVEVQGPWSVVRLPLSIAFVLRDSSSH